MENAYRRKKDPETNKQLILEAAIVIAAKKDWHQVTFQAISDLTGLSKGGIIHHFKNKEDLLNELMKESLQELTAWMNSYKKKTKMENEDNSSAFLRFVLSKGADEKYRKMMRVVLQAVLINPDYTKLWQEWCEANILNRDQKILPIESLVTVLVADGIWYAQNMGFSVLSENDKERILKHLNLET